MIHPTAIISTDAVLGRGVSIGPYCIIGNEANIGDDCQIMAHVVVAGNTAIGARTVVHPFASLGGPPQSSGYKGEPTRLSIGSDCDIRESVTMNRGTLTGGGHTRVGDRGFFMANSHVGHDCDVGDDVVFANGASAGGHCLIGAYAFIGALSGIHQFVRIGPHAIIGGVSGIRQDVIPFGLAAGAFARLSGINVVGMKRRGFSSESISVTRAAYRRLFLSEGTSAERLLQTEQSFGSCVAVQQIVDFIRSRGNRSICTANRKSG